MADVMWCEHCGVVEYELEIDKDTGYRTPICPWCGAELDQNAKKCECGEWISEDEEACYCCKETVKSAVKNVFIELGSLGWSDEGISDLFDSMIGEYFYDLRRTAKSK